MGTVISLDGRFEWEEDKTSSTSRIDFTIKNKHTALVDGETYTGSDSGNNNRYGWGPDHHDSQPRLTKRQPLPFSVPLCLRVKILSLNLELLGGVYQFFKSTNPAAERTGY
jgi:hypothetical protein